MSEGGFTDRVAAFFKRKDAVKPVIKEQIKKVEQTPGTIIGEVVIGTVDPRNLTKEQFDTTPGLLFHGTGTEFSYSSSGKYDISKVVGDGTTDYGLGFYTTDNKRQAESYSITRSGDKTKVPTVYSFLPANARMLDVRDKNNPDQNGTLPSELVIEWVAFLEAYNTNDANYANTNQFVKDTLKQGVIETFIDPTKQNLAENKPFTIRSASYEEAGIFKPNKNGLIDIAFQKFMLSKGYDGMIYREGGEGPYADSLTGYVFYNPEAIDTFEGWQARTIQTETPPQPKPETKFTYEAPGPKFVDLLKDNKNRNNPLSSTARLDQKDWNSEAITRKFTEREGLVNLNSYFEQVSAELQKLSGPESEEMKQKVKLMRENLTFIGEPELQTALQGMARHVIELAQQGKNVYLFPYGTRSEKYITLRTLEQVDAMLEGSPHLMSRIKIGETIEEIFRHWGDGIVDMKILIPDDFLVSGSTLMGVMGGARRHLSEKGVEEAEKHIESLVVASALNDSQKQPKDGSIHAYFGVPIVRKSPDGHLLTARIAMTGSHASVDYGFDETIDTIQEFLSRKSTVVPDLPLLYKVNRPYEMKEGTHDYSDEQLQKRWDKMEQKFGIKKPQTT